MEYAYPPYQTSGFVTKLRSLIGSAWFFATICLVVLLLALPYWSQRILYGKQRNTTLRVLSIPWTIFLSFCLKKMPGFPSVGHFLLLSVYFIINLVYTFVDYYPGGETYVLAYRFGYLATYNFVILVVLSMKNNVLSWVIGRSHESLNVPHRWVARTCFIQATLHVILQIVLQYQLDTIYVLVDTNVIMGYVSYICFCTIILITVIPMARKKHYEAFQRSHIFLFLLSAFFLIFHQHDLIMWGSLCLGFWALDKLIRTGKLWYYNRHVNTQLATVEALPGLATRITVPRSMKRQPGSHAFITLPTVHRFQAHPFTIANYDDKELSFIIRARDGFTLELYQQALQKRIISVPILIDGPYGQIPSFHRMDRLLLIGAGTGATFTMPIAMRVLKKGTFKSLDLVWVFKDKRDLSWFSDEFSALLDCKRVNVHLHVTKYDEIIDDVPLVQDLEKERACVDQILMDEPSSSDRSSSYEMDHKEKPTINTAISPSTNDPELGSPIAVPDPTVKAYFNNKGSSIEPHGEFVLKRGRPDLLQLIDQVVADAPLNDTIGVAACGPILLQRLVRTATAKHVHPMGRSITLHCEQFGYS